MTDGCWEVGDRSFRETGWQRREDLGIPWEECGRKSYNQRLSEPTKMMSLFVARRCAIISGISPRQDGSMSD
jgi:hypothetical protein